MSDAPKVSLSQQIEEMQSTIRTTRRLGDGWVRKGELRRPELDLHLLRQDAIWRTLRWFQDNEAEIRAFMALPPDTREIIAKHGEAVTDALREAGELLLQAVQLEAKQAGGAKH